MVKRTYTELDIRASYDNLKKAILRENIEDMYYYAEELEERALITSKEASVLENEINSLIKKFSENLVKLTDNFISIKKDIDNIKN